MAEPISARPGAAPVPPQSPVPEPMYWHARFLVGHLEIDADHLRLFAMLSRLHRRVQLGSDPAMDNALAEFVVALEQHQDREEVILAELGYDHLVEHAHHHRALTTRAAAALAMGGDGDWLLTVHLLTQTVLEHVAMEDVGLQEFFAGQGRADSHEKPMAGTAVLLPFVRPPQEMA